MDSLGWVTGLLGILPERSRPGCATAGLAPILATQGAGLGQISHMSHESLGKGSQKASQQGLLGTVRGLLGFIRAYWEAFATNGSHRSGGFVAFEP